jgi:hypothetical protein
MSINLTTTVIAISRNQSMLPDFKKNGHSFVQRRFCPASMIFFSDVISID